MDAPFGAKSKLVFQIGTHSHDGTGSASARFRPCAVYAIQNGRSPTFDCIGNSFAMRYPNASLVWVRIRSDRSRSPIGFPLASFFQETCSKSRINCLHLGDTLRRRSRL